MIDSVKLRHDIEIPEEYFSEDIWKHKCQDNFENYYWCKRGYVVFKYYPERRRFFIGGKILSLLNSSRVQNFDDVYGARRDLFLVDINAAINQLFPVPVLDISSFNVTRIDYCYNVDTPHVQEYIVFLTRAFQRVNKGTRVNFTARNGLSGSVYVKTTAEYEKNERRKYVLNFYDKSDWIQYRIRKGSNISKSDQILAENVLRLEVQCGDQKVKEIVKKFGITNNFYNLFDFIIAYDTILSVYTLVFKGNERLDYYSYKAAKKAVAGHRQAERVLLTASQGHDIFKPKFYNGRKETAEHGIYPWCFLRGNLDHLENPMQLILRKLESLGVLP